MKKILCIACILTLVLPVFACGDKPAPEKAAESETEAPITDAPATAAPTEPPPPTDPPTTEAPTEPFEPDPNQSYWEQIESELAWYGMSDGFSVFNTASESDLMKKFTAGNVKREDLDISGDNVPFSAAYRVTLAKDTVNFWDANYTCLFEKDLPLEQDDLVVGVVWIRGARIGETEQFMAEDDPQYYLAIKTPTDEWATEGDMSPRGVQAAEGEWQKVFFAGRVMNEEEKSNDVRFQIFMGYGNQYLDIGGAVAYCFPSTKENEKAVWKFVS
jgi:hypothetical protein